MERELLATETETNVEVFLHQPGMEPVLLPASEKDTLEAILDRAGIQERHLDVFVGEPDGDFGDESDDEEDRHDPLDRTTTLIGVGARQHCHVHVCHCRKVTVELFYQHKTLRRRFSPGATVARVIRWARKRLHLTDADADRLVLQVHGTTQQPRLHEHLSELVHRQSCCLVFDLVHDIRVEG